MEKDFLMILYQIMEYLIALKMLKIFRHSFKPQLIRSTDILRLHITTDNLYFVSKIKTDSAFLWQNKHLLNLETVMNLGQQQYMMWLSFQITSVQVKKI
jgi:hypothetical protein